jgi:hypothetical protein
VKRTARAGHRVPVARELPCLLGRGGRGPSLMQAGLTGEAQVGRVITVPLGRALKLARGLCFIFLFSEYNQIHANSKICTSLI